MLSRKSEPAFARYLTIIAIIIAAFAVNLAWGAVGRDHYAALGLGGDKSWYRDVYGRSAPEIQDLDLFYHNIGRSIDSAKDADIVVVGPSFVVYALDRELLRKFSMRHGIKIYDMAFIGVRGGEFSRRIIKRWKLQPKLWIINVDDQFIHFFTSSLDLTFGPKTVPIPPVKYGRLHGYLTVAGRSMRWWLEDLWAKGWNGVQQTSASGIYRNIDDGSVYLDFNPRYVATDNPAMPFDRDPNCHTNPDVVKTGRDYLAGIGGEAILMLVPHSQHCPQQARELAQAIGVEAILPTGVRYTTADGGGHLDRKGALVYTELFLAALERSAAFKKIVPAASSETK